MTRWLALALMLCSTPAAAHGVLVTLKPIHSLATALTMGTGIEPELLITSEASAHDVSLKPSQVAALREADVVFYVSPKLETFLPPLLASLPQGRAFALATDTDTNLHLWLSPTRSREILARMAQVLAQKFPQNRSVIEKNLKALSGMIEHRNWKWQQRLAALHGSYLVDHDAYGLFEKEYGFTHAGVVVDHPEQPVSAGRAASLRKMIAQKQVTCLLSEPHYDARLIDRLLAGSQVKNITIDAEGITYRPGPNLYFEMMEGVVAGFEACLK